MKSCEWTLTLWGPKTSESIPKQKVVRDQQVGIPQLKEPPPVILLKSTTEENVSSLKEKEETTNELLQDVFFTHYCIFINQGHENVNWNLFRMRPGVCKLSVDLISAKSKGVMFD